MFAPCALGAVLTERAVGRLRAEVVCGAANNQFASPQQGLDLARRGILCAPDYLVNAGGIINVAGQFLGWSAAEVQARVQRIGLRLSEVLNEAEAEGIAPHEAADTLARAIIARDARLRQLVFRRSANRAFDVAPRLARTAF